MTFGLALQRRRMARRWSKNALAARAGLTQGAIGRLERDQRQPRPPTVLALAGAFALAGNDRDEFFLAAGLAPPVGSWRSSTPEPLLVWLHALLGHPALDADARERLLLPAVESAALAAVGYLARQGVPLDDIPPPPEGAELVIEVRDRVLRIARDLTRRG